MGAPYTAHGFSLEVERPPEIQNVQIEFANDESRATVRFRILLDQPRIRIHRFMYA
jgi:hypothetical protein